MKPLLLVLLIVFVRSNGVKANLKLGLCEHVFYHVDEESLAPCIGVLSPILNSSVDLEFSPLERDSPLLVHTGFVREQNRKLNDVELNCFCYPFSENFDNSTYFIRLTKKGSPGDFPNTVVASASFSFVDVYNQIIAQLLGDIHYQFKSSNVISNLSSICPDLFWKKSSKPSKQETPASHFKQAGIFNLPLSFPQTVFIICQQFTRCLKEESTRTLDLSLPGHQSLAPDFHFARAVQSFGKYSVQLLLAQNGSDTHTANFYEEAALLAYNISDYIEEQLHQFIMNTEFREAADVIRLPAGNHTVSAIEAVAAETGLQISRYVLGLKRAVASQFLPRFYEYIGSDDIDSVFPSAQETTTDHSLLSASVIGATILVVSCLFVTFCLWRRSKLQSGLYSDIPLVSIVPWLRAGWAPNHCYARIGDIRALFETHGIRLIRKEVLRMIRPLGEGAFGCVSLAHWIEGPANSGEFEETPLTEAQLEKPTTRRSLSDKSDTAFSLSEKSKICCCCSVRSTIVSDDSVCSEEHIDQFVAVKRLKHYEFSDPDNYAKGFNYSAVEAVLREVAQHRRICHKNVVKLFGVVVQDAGGLEVMMVFEYMCHGSLNIFLRERSPITPFTGAIFMPHLNLPDLLDISAQVVSGASYLASLSLAHRDLAARNCLVSEDSFGHIVVKIGDFGLMRDVYEKSYRIQTVSRLPLRWMAPESILYSSFTVESDAYTVGVLLWEIYSFGLQPWYQVDIEEVAEKICSGEFLPFPSNCPSVVYDLMKQCWHRSPSSRIKMCELENQLLKFGKTLPRIV